MRKRQRKKLLKRTEVWRMRRLAQFFKVVAEGKVEADTSQWRGCYGVAE